MNDRRQLENRSDFEKVVFAFRHKGLGVFSVIAQSIVRRVRAKVFRFSVLNERDLETKFTKIYQARWWDEHGESASGPGSMLQVTEQFRKELSQFIQDHEIRSLFDAPCGDWNWMREMVFPEGFSYVGGEIVPQLVGNLSRKYARPGVDFIHFDITRGDFPQADVWLCRDCLFHFSFADIHRALANFVRADLPYALITNHFGDFENTDIPTGEFRLLDLTKPPFNLPIPTIRLRDYEHHRREVCLWSKTDIAAALHG